MSDYFGYRKGEKLLWSWPVASGTVIEIGDLLKNSSRKAALMATTTDNHDFIGAAHSAHGATDPSTTITVYMPLPTMVHEYPLAAATDISIGGNLVWSAKQALTNSDTNPIATAIESKLQATKIRVVFKMPAIESSSSSIRLGTGDAT
jgi:hypothetical protein